MLLRGGSDRGAEEVGEDEPDSVVGGVSEGQRWGALGRGCVVGLVRNIPLLVYSDFGDY